MGKGSARRPSEISEREFDKRWEDTFKPSPPPANLHSSNLTPARRKVNDTYPRMAEEKEK